ISRRLNGRVASTSLSRTKPCNPGCSPVPLNFRSLTAPPLARLPRMSTASFVLIATSNFQSRIGGCGKEKSGRDDGGCGAGRPGGKFAAEPLQGQRVTRKVEPALEICQRGQRRIAKPGEVHSHVASASENGVPDRPAQIYIQRHVAIEFLNRGYKLSQEIDGTSRQPDFCAKWRGLIQLPFAQNLCRVER